MDSFDIGSLGLVREFVDYLAAKDTAAVPEVVRAPRVAVDWSPWRPRSPTRSR